MTPEDEQARRVARASFVSRLFVIVFGASLALALVAVVVLALSIRSTQIEGTPTGKKLMASSNRILDCTDPSGECFKQGQRRTAKAVGDINAASLLVVVCALQVPNGTPLNEALDQVSTCVAKRLAKR